MAGPFEEARDRVADYRPAAMPDVHRPGRVGADELDHRLAPAGGVAVAESLLFPEERTQLPEEEPLRDPQVQETRSRDLHLLERAVGILDAIDDGLRERPRIGLRGPGRAGVLLLQHHRRVASEVAVSGILGRVELNRCALRRQESVLRAPVEGALEDLRDLGLHHEDTGSP